MLKSTNKFITILLAIILFTVPSFAESVSNKMIKIYLEFNYKGEQNYLYIKHKKINLVNKDNNSGIKLENNFFPLKEDFHCYKVRKNCKSRNNSSYKYIDVSLLFKIEELSKHECNKNNEIRSRHYVEIPKKLYDSIPCCGKYEDSNDYYQQYNFCSN